MAVVAATVSVLVNGEPTSPTPPLPPPPPSASSPQPQQQQQSQPQPSPSQPPPHLRLPASSSMLSVPPDAGPCTVAAAVQKLKEEEKKVQLVRKMRSQTNKKK